MTDPVNPALIAAWTGTDPDPADPNTYGTRGRARWSWEVASLVPGANTLAQQAYTNALAALEAASLSLSNANFKGAWSSLSGALNKPATVSHAGSRWSLLNNLANVAASTPGVSADWELYNPITAAGVSFDPTGTQLVATHTQDAIVELAMIAANAGLRAIAGRNLIRNRNMSGVNRVRGIWAYPQAISAGSFVQDAWRAGVGGCTVASQGMGISFGGTIVQTVFTALPYAATAAFPANTPITIAWDGTSQARVNGGAYSASPITFTPANVPLSFELEFNSGSVSKVRAHIGTVCPEWVPQGEIEAQLEADYDFQSMVINHTWTAPSAGSLLGLNYPLQGRIRSGSTVAWFPTPTVSANISGTPTISLTNGGRTLAVNTTSAASGAAQYNNLAQISSGY